MYRKEIFYLFVSVVEKIVLSMRKRVEKNATVKNTRVNFITLYIYKTFVYWDCYYLLKRLFRNESDLRHIYFFIWLLFFVYCTVCFPFNISSAGIVGFHLKLFECVSVCVCVCMDVYIDEVKNPTSALFTDTEQKALVFYFYIKMFICSQLVVVHSIYSFSFAGSGSDACKIESRFSAI